MSFYIFHFGCQRDLLCQVIFPPLPKGGKKTIAGGTGRQLVCSPSFSSHSSLFFSPFLFLTPPTSLLAFFALSVNYVIANPHLFLKTAKKTELSTNCKKEGIDLSCYLFIIFPPLFPSLPSLLFV